MKKKELLRKAGAWVLSAALAVSCLSGVPATTAEAEAAVDVTKWEKELYIDFGTGTNIVNGKDTDLADTQKFKENYGDECHNNVVAGYGSWVYTDSTADDGKDVGEVYGNDKTGQKMGFDRAVPAGVVDDGGAYFRDWVFAPDGKPYTFSVDLPKGQYEVYVYTGNKTQGYNNVSKVAFNDNDYKVVYDQTSSGGGQYTQDYHACVYTVNVEEKTSGSNYGTLKMKVFDDTQYYDENKNLLDKYTDANTVFLGDSHVTVNPNGNPDVKAGTDEKKGTIVTARLNGIEIRPIEGSPVKATGVSKTEESNEITIEKGQTDITLEAKASPAGATERMEYISLNEDVVKVDPKFGRLTGVELGEATVIAGTPSILKNIDLENFENADKSKIAVYNVTVKHKEIISLSETSMNLKVDGDEEEKTKTLTVTFNAVDDNAAKTELSIPENNNPTYAEVTLGSDVTEITRPASSDDGWGVYEQTVTVTATDAGKGESITVERSSGKTATCPLTVTRRVTSVVFCDEKGEEVTEYKMTAGNTLTVTAKGKPDNASNKDVTYQLKAEAGVKVSDIATIGSNNGKITAKKSGKLTIIATSQDDNSIKKTATLIIEPVISAIAFANGSMNLTAGQTGSNKLNITYAADAPEDKSSLNTTINYTSSNEAVAKVDGEGKVTAVAAGSATITAVTDDGGKTASYTVNVSAAAAGSVSVPATNVTVKNTKVTLKKVGATATISASLTPSNSTDTISYISGNPKVVTVTDKGVITAVGPGTTTITVKASSGKTAVVTVTVKNPATKVKISGKSKITLKKGKKKTLKVKVTPKNSTDKVKWSSSKKKVATVSSKGVVTAKKKGKAKITAKAGKFKATVTVTVK